jgi:hypothetical protein
MPRRTPKPGAPSPYTVNGPQGDLRTALRGDHGYGADAPYGYARDGMPVGDGR